MFGPLVVRFGGFLLAIFVVFVLSFIYLWLLSLYGANECNVRDECMFPE